MIKLEKNSNYIKRSKTKKITIKKIMIKINIKNIFEF